MLTTKQVTEHSWNYYQPPFDTAKCGCCVTQHARAKYGICVAPEHEELRRAAIKAFPDLQEAPSTEWLRKNYRKILKLRRDFAKLWK